ncbi:hypothetical protein TNCV_3103611 [Trichonephila clavipes]|nr:hypothetical protein TNCV_3103611 [Trichonephila clavipes]
MPAIYNSYLIQAQLTFSRVFVSSSWFDSPAVMVTRTHSQSVMSSNPVGIEEDPPIASDDDLAASNNSDNDDGDYVESVAQGKNISSDDEEIDEMQCSTFQPKAELGKIYIKNRSPPELTETYPIQNRRWSEQEMFSLQYQKRRSAHSMAVSVGQRATVPSSKQSCLL